MKRPFVPPTVTLKQVHDAVPKHLLRKDPFRSASYVIRDVLLCAVFFGFAMTIEPLLLSNFGGRLLLATWQIPLIRAVLWLTYWWWQGLAFAGFFCIGERGPERSRSLLF